MQWERYCGVVGTVQCRVAAIVRFGVVFCGMAVLAVHTVKAWGTIASRTAVVV